MLENCSKAAFATLRGPLICSFSVRLLFTVAMLALLAGSSAMPASAASSTSAACNNVSIPTGIATRRNVGVTVPVLTDDLTGGGVISYDYRVTYDPAVLSFVSVSQTGTLSNGMTITINPNTAGTLVVSGFGTVPLSSSGVLLNLNFTAVGPIGSSSPVSFGSFAFNEGVPCVATTNGSVSIVSGDVTGAVTYANAVSVTPVPNVTLSGAGSVNTAAQSGFNGLYTLSGFGAGAYVVTPSKSGDVNGISSFDSALIAQHVVGLTTLGATQLIAADVSANNAVTSFDAALIAQYVVLIANSGITGTWKFVPASRNYPNVETNQTGQDYAAILMGEVSGNWTPPVPFSGLSTHKAEQLAPQAVNVSTTNQIAAASQPILIPINVGDTTGSGIISYQFDMAYDPAVITPSSTPCQNIGSLSANMVVVCNVPSPGLLKVAAFGVAPLTGSGFLLRLSFNTNNVSERTSVLDLQNFSFNEDPLLLGSLTDGSVRVIAPTAAGVEVSGQLVALGGVSAGTVVTLTDSAGAARSVRANSFGFFRFEGVPSGRSYVLTARARDLVFGSQVVEVSDSVTGLVIVATPR